jgi:flagellar basal-body rod modification protein FlgD
MTTVAPLAAAATGSSQAAKDSVTFGKDFDSFLTLLTSQLKYQDPLSPMDSTQFTTQLVQFTSVEQQIKQNKNLESIMAMQQTIQLSSASNYIGKTVEAGGKSVVLNGGAASISYKLESAAKEVSVAIKNSSGEVVRTLTGSPNSGSQTVSWDGRSASGTRLADGTYSYVVTAKNGTGQTMPVKTGYTGTITGFDVADGGAIILRAGAARIPIGDVTSVSTASTVPPASSVPPVPPASPGAPP